MSNAHEDLKTLLENPVLIYGAGRGAFRIILNLKALNANIIGLAVSDVNDNRTLTFNGYRVQTPDAYNSYKDTAVVLIATSEKYHDEIKENCISLGYKNFISHSSELMELSSYFSHRKLFEKYGLPFDKEIITVGKGKYLNPYSDIFPSKFGIVDQWEDICSTAFGDVSISFEGPYEYSSVKITKGDIALDIGASVGYISVYAVSRGAEVYAFEPNVENHPMIERHNELNGNKIHLEPYAVSDRCGSAEFWVSSVANAGNSLDSNIGGGESSITVPEITVDEFVRQRGLKRVDYLHTNIMGFERNMLRGARETLKKFSPKIVICAYQYPDDKEVLSNLILEGDPEYKIEFFIGKLYAYKP